MIDYISSVEEDPGLSCPLADKVKAKWSNTLLLKVTI